MSKAEITPKGTPVPARPANAPANQDGTYTPVPDATGMTDGQGNPVPATTPANDAPLASQVSEAAPLNTTGLGANSVEGNNVGGRGVEQGVPAGVVDRVKEQKQREQDGEDRA